MTGKTIASGLFGMEVIMLNEVSQRRINTEWYHLYVESKIIQQTSEYNKKETYSQT